MKKLYDRGEANGAAIFAARHACRKQQECRTKALPPSTQKVSGNFRHGRESRIALACKLLFDQDKVVTDKIKNLFDRQQRDSVSPELTLFVVT
jgi:hypothetical protein